MFHTGAPDMNGHYCNDSHCHFIIWINGQRSNGNGSSKTSIQWTKSFIMEVYLALQFNITVIYFPIVFQDVGNNNRKPKISK